MYPANDEQFEDTHVAKVTKESSGWSIARADGWHFGIPADSPIAPEIGMPARFYGKGIGSTVRGLFLAGVKVFYRTEDEEKEHSEIQMFGADAADWLKRWDAGQGVWSIEMGGLGPGYEQYIHITAAEILRHCLAEKVDTTKLDDGPAWLGVREGIEKMSHENTTITKLGLSGAQWGAAMNLAMQLYRKGPRAMMTDERVKDRHIQVSRNFPEG